MTRKERMEALELLVPAKNSCLKCDDLWGVGASLAFVIDLLQVQLAGDRKDDFFRPAMSDGLACSLKAPLKERFEAVETAVRSAWSMYCDGEYALLLGDRRVARYLSDAVWELSGVYDQHENEWRKDDDDGRKGEDLLRAERDTEGSVQKQV